MLTTFIPAEIIDRRILLIRDQKVMLDSDLAVLYDIETRTLIQAIKRNMERFPADFMFQLDDNEYDALRSQSVISNTGRGGRRYNPYAFTEYGVAMLSSVLKSRKAILVNIEIMRVFGKLREILSNHKELAHKLTQLERKYDSQFKAVFDAIRALMNPPPSTTRKIGFTRESQ